MPAVPPVPAVGAVPPEPAAWAPPPVRVPADGEARVRAGERSSAWQTFREAATLNADNAPREEGQIIETYRAKKDFAKAQSEADAALAKYPNDRMLAEAQGGTGL